MTRPTNPELCRAFRALLTEGFYIPPLDNSTPEAHKLAHDATLYVTRPWRNDLWKAFAEIEERLDPLGTETRRREKLHAQLAGKITDGPQA